jgi:hypothetical protein
MKKLKLKQGNKLVGSWSNIQNYITRESRNKASHKSKSLITKPSVLAKPVFVPKEKLQ